MQFGNVLSDEHHCNKVYNSTCFVFEKTMVRLCLVVAGNIGHKIGKTQYKT